MLENYESIHTPSTSDTEMTSLGSTATLGVDNIVFMKESLVEERDQSHADNSEQHSDDTFVNEEAAIEDYVKFSPPLYKQRYDCVSSILGQQQVVSVSISQQNCCSLACLEFRLERDIYVYSLRNSSVQFVTY
jgi:hypothetical protein